MKEIFILENMAACKNFISDQEQNGSIEDSFLGVGCFSSSLLNSSTNEGLSIKVTPHFLEQDVIDYIVRGHISILEKEPILIQAKDSDNYIHISKWLILGQHTALFSLPKSEVLKHLPSSPISNVDEFVNSYFNFIVAKMNEMRAKIVVILFDIDMFKRYLLKYFSWLDKENKLLHFPPDIEPLIIKELLHSLSNTFFNNIIAIVPSNQNHFNLFINTIHEIKKDLNSYSEDVTFKF